MSKRAGVFTNTQRQRLFFNKGCSGCLAYLVFLPIEIAATIFLGVLEAIFKPSKHPFRRRRFFKR